MRHISINIDEHKQHIISVAVLTVETGVGLPLLSKRVRWFATDSAAFVVGRAFAAGVVLATGFVHLFPDAMENLSSPCLGWGGAWAARCPCPDAAIMPRTASVSLGDNIRYQQVVPPCDGA